MAANAANANADVLHATTNSLLPQAQPMAIN